METILIQATDEKELKLIETFIEKHHLKGRILSDDQKEDIVLGKLMEEEKNGLQVDVITLLSEKSLAEEWNSEEDSRYDKYFKR